MKRIARDVGLLAVASIPLVVVAVVFAGWINNVIWTFTQTETYNVLLGILGCLLAPVGALHGIWLWFN